MWRTASTAGAVGIEIALAIAVGYLGGNWLDKKLDTTPWLTIFGLVAGVGAAIKALMHVVRLYKKDLQRADAQENSNKKDPES